ncbi:MAG: RNA 2',3'-cyclic phosphodiesterase [Deltaproteobacteria bacterium]|nr:MAG: RNA 2',3'-cyclic phosphodiesterase [Deltaproteobacteria bacterium]
MEIRSFLAFELPGEMKEILFRVSGKMKGFGLDVRWVRVDNIHLTVIFIGNISTDRLNSMDRIVTNVCVEFKPFDIALKGAGVFSGRHNPRVLWIGLAGDTERLATFRDRLQDALAPLGIKKEKRRFRPHLTLGRFRKGATGGMRLNRLLETCKNLSSPVHSVGELVLFRSELTPGGAVYTRLNAWPLTGEN